jgi:hypothetical protein
LTHAVFVRSESVGVVDDECVGTWDGAFC